MHAQITIHSMCFRSRSVVLHFVTLICEILFIFTKPIFSDFAWETWNWKPCVYAVEIKIRCKSGFPWKKGHTTCKFSLVLIKQKLWKSILWVYQAQSSVRRLKKNHHRTRKIVVSKNAGKVYWLVERLLGFVFTLLSR